MLPSGARKKQHFTHWGSRHLSRQQISASLKVEEMIREEPACRSTRRPLNREDSGEMSGSKGFAEKEGDMSG